MGHQQNIAIARKLLEGIGGGQDPAEIAALFDADFVFEIQGDDGVLSRIGRKTGRQAIADFIRDIRTLTEPASFDVEDILASEGRAVIIGELRTRIKATGKVIAMHFVIILTITGDVVTRFQILDDSFDVSKDTVFSFTLKVFQLGINRHGKAVTTYTVKSSGTPTPPKSGFVRLTRNNQIGIQMLRRAFDRHGKPLPAQPLFPPGVQAVTANQWREVFYQGFPSDREHTKRKTFNQVKADLLSLNVISSMGNFVWFTNAEVPMNSAATGVVNSFIYPTLSCTSVMAARRVQARFRAHIVQPRHAGTGRAMHLHPLVLVTDNGRRRRFALWRHEHNPPEQVAIQLPLDEELQDALAGILTVWNVPAAALVWLDRPIAPSSTP
jgi:uncharacterized protein